MKGARGDERSMSEAGIGYMGELCVLALVSVSLSGLGLVELGLGVVINESGDNDDA
jgi:hypothetical protein